MLCFLICNGPMILGLNAQHEQILDLVVFLVTEMILNTKLLIHWGADIGGYFGDSICRYTGNFFSCRIGSFKDFKWGQIFSLASERKDIRIFSTPSITVIHGGGDADEKSGSGKSKIQILDTRSVGTYSYNGYGSRTNENDPSSSLTDRTAKTELAISNPRIRKTVIDENGTVYVVLFLCRLR